MISAFLDALGADGPAADRAGRMDLYGRFVGSWDLDVRHFFEDGTERRRAGEWHFGWALEGRAIQDVWIVPPRGEQRRGDAGQRRGAQHGAARGCVAVPGPVRGHGPIMTRGRTGPRTVGTAPRRPR